ncbi:MAG: HD domain-containing protein [Candidatus Micrarchaeia archaeon]
MISLGNTRKKMSGDDTDNQLLSFFAFIEKLKSVDREGWKISGLKKFEHVGDHSYSVALLSYVFARIYKLDANKCMSMGLIHDIGEALTGDIATRLDERDQIMSSRAKNALEDSATRKVLRSMPTSGRSYLLELWDEYHNGVTQEAKLVRQVDKLDMILTLKGYAHQMSSDRINEFFGTAGRVIDGSFPKILDIYESIRRSVFRGKK